MANLKKAKDLQGRRERIFTNDFGQSEIRQLAAHFFVC